MSQRELRFKIDDLERELDSYYRLSKGAAGPTTRGSDRRGRGGYSDSDFPVPRLNSNRRRLADEPIYIIHTNPAPAQALAQVRAAPVAVAAPAPGIRLTCLRWSF